MSAGIDSPFNQTPPSPGEIFIHIKSGNLYTVVGSALNSTNGQPGLLVIYICKDGTFAREVNEFMEKFIRKR